MTTTIRDLVRAVSALRVEDMRNNPRIEAVWAAFRDLPPSAFLARDREDATPYATPEEAHASADAASDTLPQDGLRFCVGRPGWGVQTWIVTVRDRRDEVVGWL